MGVESGMRILNRDVIKYAAMLAMLLNHIANIFLAPGTPLLYGSYHVLFSCRGI